MCVCGYLVNGRCVCCKRERLLHANTGVWLLVIPNLNDITSIKPSEQLIMNLNVYYFYKAL